MRFSGRDFSQSSVFERLKLQNNAADRRTVSLLESQKLSAFNEIKVFDRKTLLMRHAERSTEEAAHTHTETVHPKRYTPKRYTHRRSGPPTSTHDKQRMIWNSVVLGRWFVGCSNVQSLRDFEIEKLVQWVDGWIVNAVRTRRTRNASAGRRAMSVHAHTLAETVYCTRTEFILNTMYACNVRLQGRESVRGDCTVSQVCRANTQANCVEARSRETNTRPQRTESAAECHGHYRIKTLQC